MINNDLEYRTLLLNNSEISGLLEYLQDQSVNDVSEVLAYVACDYVAENSNRMNCLWNNMVSAYRDTFGSSAKHYEVKAQIPEDLPQVIQTRRKQVTESENFQPMDIIIYR